MVKKLTNEIIDFRLRGRNIGRIGAYDGGHKKIYFCCLITECNYKWEATPSHIFHNKSGCPKCAGNFPLTNEIIDQRLFGRNIQRIGDYKNGHIKIKWQCLIENCLHIWGAVPYNILYNNRGCPFCRLKNETLIFTLLKNNNILFENQKDIRKIDFNENKKYKVDFYLPRLNIIIEYNGAQHYESTRFSNISWSQASLNLKKQKLRDQYIRDFCIKNNLFLIEIDGRIFKQEKLKNAVIDVLIPFIKNQ